MNINFINKDFEAHFYDTIVPTIERLEGSELSNYFAKVVGPLVAGKNKIYDLDVDDLRTLGKFRKQIVVPLSQTSTPVPEIKASTPQGIKNPSGVNCAFNSVVQTLRVIPEIRTQFQNVDISSLRNQVQLGEDNQVDASEILDKLSVNLLYVDAYGKPLKDEKTENDDVEKVATDKNGIPLADQYKNSSYLYVTGFMPERQVEKTFQGRALSGGIIHYGNDNNGHYTAIVKEFGRWYVCDDGYVKELTEREALNRLKNATTRLYLGKQIENSSPTRKEYVRGRKDLLMDLIRSIFESVISLLIRS